jgi:hypothetical protein
MFKFFVYLHNELRSRWPITRIQETTAVKQKINTKQTKNEKIDQLRLFTFKREFLKISVYLETAVLAAETHLDEGQ